MVLVNSINGMRKQLGILIVVVLLVIGASAQTLTLLDGWQLILENSVSHKLAVLELEGAKITYLRAKADNLLANLKSNEQKAEENYLKAQRAYDSSVQNLLITYLENVLSVKTLERQVEIRAEKLTQAQTAYDNGYKKWELKNISDADLRNLKIGLDQAKSNLENTKSQLSLAKKDLTFLLGINEWALASDWLNYNPCTETLDIVLKDLDSLEKVTTAEDQLESAKTALEDAIARGDATLDIQEAELEVLKAELNLESVKNEQEKQLIRSFNTLKQSENSYLSAKEAYDNERLQLDIAKKQREAGVITKEELANAEIALTEKAIALEESLLTYYKNMVSLEQARGRGEAYELKLENIVETEKD